YSINNDIADFLYLYPNFFYFIFFFFNDTPTTEISTLSLHDALPISADPKPREAAFPTEVVDSSIRRDPVEPRQHAMLFGIDHLRDRKSTRLNSSHVAISYAVFCLKKKKKNIKENQMN